MPILLDVNRGKTKGELTFESPFLEKVEKIDDSAFSENVTSKIGHSDSGILPPVVKYISPTRRIVLFERPPTPVSLTFHGLQKKDVSKARGQEYDIMLPWMMYGIIMDQHNWPTTIYLYALRGPIQNGEDPLYEIPLPNIHPDDRFCLPDTSAYSTFEDISLAQGINTAYELIWSSNFNTDLWDKVSNAYRHGYPREFFEIIGNERSRVSVANMLTAWSRMDDELVPNIGFVPSNVGTVNNFINTQSEKDQQASSGSFMANQLVESVRLLTS